MALLLILAFIMPCLKCYCRYKIYKREESGRISNANGNGTSREDSVGPIGGFNGEPAGGYNLPSVEVQYPPQQYTNAINEYTSRKYTGEPTGEPTRGPTGETTGEPAGDNNLPPREAQYPERGQYFSTGQFFTKNQPESAV